MGFFDRFKKRTDEEKKSDAAAKWAEAAGSKRAQGPMVRFNCAAIPGELAEAELFGHARGAFTGAAGARAGFFKQADGGTHVANTSEVGAIRVTGYESKGRINKRIRIEVVDADTAQPG